MKKSTCSLYCQSCNDPVPEHHIMADGFTRCCGANTIDKDGNIVIKPHSSWEKKK